jgi:hypothetical protein
MGRRQDKTAKKNWDTYQPYSENESANAQTGTRNKLLRFTLFSLMFCLSSFVHVEAFMTSLEKLPFEPKPEF